VPPSLQRSFDHLARVYEMLERLTYGRSLQTCRTALLPRKLDAQQVRVVGEGDGRFVEVLCQANPQASITVVDASSSMLERCRERLAALPARTANATRPPLARVSLVHASILELAPVEPLYDLVVCNFVLDCFTTVELRSLLPRLRSLLLPGGRLVMGDFAVPPGGVLQRLLARAVLWLMYRCFRAVTPLSAHSLAPIDLLLEEAGFRQVERRELLGGFLHSGLWMVAPDES
jgi:ubiquinone/menaquinone biosynthesis C-methylase UbiE